MKNLSSRCKLGSPISSDFITYLRLVGLQSKCRRTNKFNFLLGSKLFVTNVLFDKKLNGKIQICLVISCNLISNFLLLGFSSSKFFKRENGSSFTIKANHNTKEQMHKHQFFFFKDNFPHLIITRL